MRPRTASRAVLHTRRPRQGADSVEVGSVALSGTPHQFALPPAGGGTAFPSLRRTLSPLLSTNTAYELCSVRRYVRA